MNLFNLFGTGQDLNTGAFITLNGKKLKESIADIKKAYAEAENMDGSKRKTIFSWLMGNFNKDYDLAKDLDSDVAALQKFKDKLNNNVAPATAMENLLKNGSVTLQEFAKNADEGTLSLKNFFSSVTGAGKLTNAIKGIGLQMLTTAGQAAAIWAITEGFRLVVNAVQDYVNRAEIAKEKMEESIQAYRFTMTSTNFGSNSMPRCFLTGNQRRAAAKERIKDDAIGHGRVSDRILAEIEDNHMRERDTKIGLAEQRQVAFLGIAFQILPLKSKQKKSTLRGKLSKCSFRKQSAN